MFSNRFSRPMMAVLALAGGALQSASAQNLTVNPFRLTVNFQRNTTSGNAVSRALEVTNITTRVQITTTIDNPTNVNWLFINPTVLNPNEGATRRVDLTMLTGALFDGTFTGSVRLVPEGGGATVTVPITLVVSNQRMQNVTPSALEFVLQRGSGRSSSVPINVTATDGALSVTAAAQSSPSAWLLVDPGPVTTPAPFGVSVQVGDLVPGEYLGSITLGATGNNNETLGNPSLIVPVRLRVVDDSKLSAAPASLSFDYQLNGPVPPARSIAVSSTGSPLAFSVEQSTPGTNVQWLAVSPVLASTPQNLSVSLQNLNNLPAGTYQGNITVKSGTQTQIVTVTLRVAVDPLLTVTPAQLIFTYQMGGPQPARQAVIASNFGNPASITAAPLGNLSPWLVVATPSAVTPSALVIGVNPANLSPGTYDGAVEIRGNFGNSPLQLPVRLVVSGSNQSLLRVNQNQLNFAFQTGSSNSTLSQVINVTTTATALNYSASAVGGAGWLSVAQQGTQQATPSNVTVAVTPGSLPPGVYTGQVSIQTPEQNAVPILIPVRLVISTQPLLAVSPASLTFTATGSSTTLRQTITVGSTGNNFAYQATSSIAGGGNWLVSAQSGPSTGTTVEVGVNPTVTEGSGLVTITAPGIENSPVFVPVTLTGAGVTSQLTVTPSTVDFVQVIGSPVPPAQTLEIGLGQGVGLASYRITEIRYLNGSGWLRLSKAAGIAPDRLEVSIDSQNLQPGRYAATIPFESPAGNRDVVVFLEVRRVVSGFTVNTESLTFAFTPGGQVPAAQPLIVGSTGENIPFTVEARVPAGTSPWLQHNVPNAAATTPAQLNISVNPAGLPGGTYQGTINIIGAGGVATRVVNITLNVANVVTPALSRMVNAASFLDVPAVPGMIVSLIGTNLGPATGVSAAPNGSGVFDRQLSNVKVIFDTFEAPILFVSAGQVNAVVPYLVAPRLTTRVLVEVNGVRSNVIELRVAATSPGIFLLNAAGQGAILNQDSSVNGPGNPAARDSVVVIYATGEGQTNPPGVDGTIPGRSTALKTPVGRVRVRIGGQEADVLYAGSAPLLVSGLLQVNAKVPLGVVPGSAVPIEVTVGDTTSASGVTVAIR